LRLGKYIKAAFMNHWNLLGFGAGLVFAFLTGKPDIVAPLVMAGEVAYLGLLGTHPKFQKAVDAQDAKRQRDSQARTSDEALKRILRALPADSLRRYESLHQRCRDLRRITLDLRSPGRRRSAMPFERLQLQGLDRLLWIFLRLLYTEWSLDRFLAHTDEDAIRDDVLRLEFRLKEFRDDETNPRKMKARETIKDTLETARARLDNLRKARENHELVQLELERLENKISSLSELAVSRQEPEFITDQVDAVATSMIETERTMNELQFATGLTTDDESIPELMSRDRVEA